MKIGTNIFSLTASRNLNRVSDSLARSLERLSSGQRINSAQDDTVGLSMTNRLNAQIRGVSQAVQNANQGYSLLSVTDGALGEMTNILQSIRDLAVQAANGTLTTSDRSSINDQIAALVTEYQRIVDGTEFNGHKVLDGSTATVDLAVGSGATDNLSLDFHDLSAVDVFEKTIGTGTYQTQTSFSAYGGSGMVELVDLNSDGNLDLLSVDIDTDALSVWMGNGDGTFRIGDTYAAGNNPVSMRTGDLNGDGVMDAAVGSVLDDSVGVFIGNGDGTFKAIISYAATDANYGVNLGDLDGDGDLDLLAGGSSDETIGIFLNDGTGTFGDMVTISSGTTTRRPQLGDLNGDGILDIGATEVVGNGYAVFIGNGDGTFEAAVTYATGAGPEENILADVNNDGYLDVLADQSTGNDLNVLLGNGDGSFQAVQVIDVNTQIYGVKASDVNGDGNLDAILELYGVDGVGILLGNGDGSFQDMYSFYGGDAVSAMDVADVDNDGIADIVSGTNTDEGIYVHLANSHEVTGVADLTFDDATDAAAALTIIDTALAKLSTERSSIGTNQNRLETVVSSLYTKRENLAQAYSDLMDVDIAMETAELVRNQILQQAGIAVLAQANLMQASVLDLLR